MKMFNKFAVVALVGGLSIAGASPASAVPIQVAFNIAAFGSFTADGTGDITTATTISGGNPFQASAVLANNINLLSTTSITLTNPLGVMLGNVFTKTFTTSSGTFVETLTVTSRTPSLNALGLEASGTIVQTVGTGFDPTEVFFSAAFTQNQGPSGGQINASFNNSTTPPRGVPEPTSMVLLGLGMLGAGIARRRKQ